jgi:nitroreductase
LAEASAIPELTPWLARQATVREFDLNSTIPDDEVREMVDAGWKAPTSGTVQMYSFVWVRDPLLRERIYELCDRGTEQIEVSCWPTAPFVSVLHRASWGRSARKRHRSKRTSNTH